MPLKQLDTYLFSSQYCQKVAKDKNDKLTSTYTASTVPNRNNSLNLSMNMWRAWLMWQKQILSYNRWQKFGTAKSSKFRKLFVKLFVTSNLPIGEQPQSLHISRMILGQQTLCNQMYKTKTPIKLQPLTSVYSLSVPLA